MIRLSALVALVSVVASSSPADAKCMQLELRPRVLNANVELTADGGGIIVATEGLGRDDKAEQPADQPNWKIRSGRMGALTPPEITTLAPGLVAYRLPAIAKVGELVTGKKKLLGTWKSTAAKRALLAAPAIKAIEHTADDGKFSSADTVVKLDGTVPATAIAMILVDAKGKALTWGIANPGVGAVRVYSHGHCDIDNGTLAPSVGDAVTLVWVDKHGRLSPASKPQKVVKGPA